METVHLLLLLIVHGTHSTFPICLIHFWEKAAFHLQNVMSHVWHFALNWKHSLVLETFQKIFPVPVFKEQLMTGGTAVLKAEVGPFKRNL